MIVPAPSSVPCYVKLASAATRECCGVYVCENTAILKSGGMFKLLKRNYSQALEYF